MRWNEVDGILPRNMHGIPADADPGTRRCLVQPAAARKRHRGDVLASMRVWLLIWLVTLMLLLEDDAAMLAFMFC